MYYLFGGIERFLKISNINIDNSVFRLHYKATTILLIIFSLVVSSRQFLGDPIACITGDPRIQSVMETYCWITSTFTVPSKFGINGVHVLAPGVSSYVEGKDEVKYHKYYQWVCFCLFFQAILFYIPHYIWKIWEGGRISTLAEDLKFASIQGDLIKKACESRCQYFKENLHHHNPYFVRYVFCEILNFANVILQMFLVDSFLGGEFTTYGTEVLNFTEQDHKTRIDPMSYIFPKVTKCTFHKYGSSGTISRIDAVCILPLNVMNEKVYIFLWFWFIILGSVSGLALMYRMATIFLPRMRYITMKSDMRAVPSDDVRVVTDNFYIGDYFVLRKLGSNADPMFMRELVIELAKRFRELSSQNGEM